MSCQSTSLFSIPEPNSIHSLIRKRPRSRLYTVPLLWTNEQVEILNCKFIDKTPPSEDSLPEGICLFDDFGTRLRALQIIAKLRGPTSLTPVELLGDLLQLCGLQDLEFHDLIPFYFDRHSVNLEKYNLFQHPPPVTEASILPVDDICRQEVIDSPSSPDAIDAIMHDLDNTCMFDHAVAANACHGGPLRSDNMTFTAINKKDSWHENQNQEQAQLLGFDYDTDESLGSNDRPANHEDDMIHDSIESSGITSHPISWQLATIDFANIDRLRRKLCGLKQQAPCTQKPKKFKGERTHQPNARIRTKIYRNLKPKVPWHDPYILALLIALAQQQHREERYNNRWTRYKVQVLAAPDNTKTSAFYLYTSHIPSELLRGLDRPFKEFNSESIEISVYHIDFDEEKSLYQRLLYALYAEEA